MYYLYSAYFFQMPSILFHNESICFTLRDKMRIREWLNTVSHQEGKKIISLNYVFCNDEHLLNINKTFLKHTTYTDVITFDYSNINLKSETRNPKPISSDIFISIPRVRENALLYKTTFCDELHRVMVHGLLHLLGYKDKSAADKALVRKKEDYYLSLRREKKTKLNNNLVYKVPENKSRKKE